MKFINEQKYSECQLVAILNAATSLGEVPVDPNSEEYERLVDFIGARHGSAIRIHAAVNYLRLRMDSSKFDLSTIRRSIKKKVPLCVNVYDKKAGNHTVCIVDLKGKGKNTKLKIPNLSSATNQWIKWKDLERIVIPDNDFGSIGGYAKSKHVYLITKQEI